MITTVTTVTVTTVAVIGMGATLSVAAVLTLIGFLATRELASGSNSGAALRIARLAGIGIIPLAITFAVMLAIKLAEIL